MLLTVPASPSPSLPVTQRRRWPAGPGQPARPQARCPPSASP